MELKPIDRRTAKPGDRLVMRANTEVTLRLKGFGHDGVVIARIDDGVLPGFTPRDVIARQLSFWAVQP